ncbi:MAG: C39 family peptidase [Deltaproteobacteria bacterium]|nr:C39 family peptidase [Deltaproteobacteria bacterium]
MGALIIAGIFAVLVSFTSDFFPLLDQPKPEINLAVPGPGPGHIRVHVNPVSEINKDHLIKQNYDFSCGSAALAILLNFYLGEKFTEKQVIYGLLHYGDPAQIEKRQAFSLLDMKKFVTALGYKADGFKLDLNDLSELKAPCIIPIKIFEYRHFVVFRGIYKGHVVLTDPWRGDISFPLNDFGDIWYEKVAFMVSREDNLPVLSKLRLKTEDLNFIDEDAAREIISPNWFNEMMAASDREFKQLVDIPGEFQYYKARK